MSCVNFNRVVRSLVNACVEEAVSHCCNKSRSMPKDIGLPYNAWNGDIAKGTCSIRKQNWGNILWPVLLLVTNHFKEVIIVRFSLSTFAFPAACIGLEKMCLICSNLQSSAISLFLKAVPPSVSIAFTAP